MPILWNKDSYNNKHLRLLTFYRKVAVNVFDMIKPRRLLKMTRAYLKGNENGSRPLRAQISFQNSLENFIGYFY